MHNRLIDLCRKIKKYDFNLRLSLNMTDWFNTACPVIRACEIFELCKNLGADQITFRVLYQSAGRGTEQDRWISRHAASEDVLDAIKKYVRSQGRVLEILEFGQKSIPLTACR